VAAPGAYAVPHLQLFIDGATYDWDTQTWVLATPGGVDLYVISANETHEDVMVSIALGGFDEYTDPDGIVSVSGFGGPAIDDWTWGYSPLESAPGFDGNEDLPPHGIYPTWFAQVNTGDYALYDSYVGDVQPPEGMQTPPWDPSDPLNGEHPADGDFKMFSLSINAPIGTSLHFDAYTLIDGRLDEFAPFSHDASTTIVPEPGTILLMSTGLFGVGLAAFRRRKR
jgi:hypothetical protein